ncbi:MAG: FAD-dependent thymidylate synthase [Caldilineaceae bacterium]
MTTGSALHHVGHLFYEGISRTCTHQLVRHCLASFSQESQRYVDLSKGGWQAVIPQAVADNPEAMAVMAAFWQDAEDRYAQLRGLGIRKEDARFLLPNAAETRIVTTMNFAAWSHFLWLRAVDKAGSGRFGPWGSVRWRCSTPSRRPSSRTLGRLPRRFCPVSMTRLSLTRYAAAADYFSRYIGTDN